MKYFMSLGVVIVFFLTGCSTGEKAVNLPPVIVLEQAEKAGNVNEPLIVSAVNSYDPEGDEVKFFWSLVEVPGPSKYTVLADRYTPVAVLIPDVPGVYTLSVTASDGINVSGPENITVVISPEAVMPAVYVRGNTAVGLTESVELWGDLSVNPMEESPEFYWELISSPPGSEATLSVTEGVYTSFVADVSHGVYKVKLTLRNRYGVENAEEVAVTVKNSPPSVSAYALNPPFYAKNITVSTGESITFDVRVSDADGDTEFYYIFTFKWDSYSGTEPAGAGFFCPGESGYRNACVTRRPSEVSFYTGDEVSFEGKFEISVTAVDIYGGSGDDTVILERAPVAPPVINFQDVELSHRYHSGNYSVEGDFRVEFSNPDKESQVLTYSVESIKKPRHSCEVEVYPEEGAIFLLGGEKSSVRFSFQARGEQVECTQRYEVTLSGCFDSKCTHKNIRITGINRRPDKVTFINLPRNVEVECKADVDGRYYSTDAPSLSVNVMGTDPDGDPLHLIFSSSSRSVNGAYFSPASLKCNSGDVCSVNLSLKGARACLKKEWSWCIFFPCYVCTQYISDALREGKTFITVQTRDDFSSGPSVQSYVNVKCRN